MPKKVKKVVSEKVGETTLTPKSDWEFITEFNAWDEKCERLGGIATIGMKGNLYDYFANHVTKPRTKSPNSGTTGVYKLLRRFRRRLANVSVPKQREIDLLTQLIQDLDKLVEADSTLNPQNIRFSRPKKFSKKGKYVKDEEMIPIYGSYIDDYFAARTGKPSRQGSWSSLEPNTATPPAYQALYGGTLFPNGGLKEILERAMNEIDGKKYSGVIDSSKDSNMLVKIPEIKSATTGWLRSATHGNEVSISTMKEKMQGRYFKVTDDNRKTVMQYGSSEGLVAGEITTYRLKLSDEDIKEYVLAYWSSLKGKAGKKADYTTFAKSWKHQLKGWVFVA